MNIQTIMGYKQENIKCRVNQMKCFKCQNGTFNKSIITAQGKLQNMPHEDKFEVLTCKKCHLTQWYDYYVVYGDEKYKSNSRPAVTALSMP